jgi:hypothetical protein
VIKPVIDKRFAIALLLVMGAASVPPCRVMAAPEKNDGPAGQPANSRIRQERKPVHRV